MRSELRFKMIAWLLSGECSIRRLRKALALKILPDLVSSVQSYSSKPTVRHLTGRKGIKSKEN